MVVLNVVLITLGQVLPRNFHREVLTRLGQVIAYGIDAGFAGVSGGWRWMVGLGSVPAALQVLFLLFLPESRWFRVDRETYKQFLIAINFLQREFLYEEAMTKWLSK